MNEVLGVITVIKSSDIQLIIDNNPCPILQL